MDSATNTVDALNRVADSIDRLAFIHGWGVIVGAGALAIAFGWILWRGPR